MKQTLTRLTIVTAAIAVMVAGAFVSPAPRVAADAKYCDKNYAPKSEKQERLGERHQACLKGYEAGKNNVCTKLKKTKLNSKAELQKACKNGVTERKKDDKEAERCKKNPKAKGCETADSEDPSEDGCPPTIIIPCTAGSSGGIEDNPVWGLLLMVIRIMTAGVALAAIGGFIYGAILYTTASGNASQVTKAKETLLNVAIGLVTFALMYGFLEFLIPGGIFG